MFGFHSGMKVWVPCKGLLVRYTLSGGELFGMSFDSSFQKTQYNGSNLKEVYYLA